MNLSDHIRPSQNCIKPVPEPSLLVEKELEINLKDCLACSGCVTSAETVLVNGQTNKTFLKLLGTKEKSILVSLSPQTICSFASKYNCEATLAFSIICHILRLMGVDHVVETNSYRGSVLLECLLEFKNREIRPLLTSACPGWICYAEKTKPFIIPHLSRVKSPMQVTGDCCKRKYGSSLYHLSVMPCYDKKLEASRQVFEDELRGKHVDCVLTTKELDSTFIDLGYNFISFNNIPLVEMTASHIGSSAGGYLEFLLSKVSKDKPIITNNRGIIEYTTQDYKFAAVHGFKRIQTIMRKMKLNQIKYDYIEIMACPGACGNGNGQLENGNVETNTIYRNLTIKEPKEKVICDMYTDFNAVKQEITNFSVQW